MKYMLLVCADDTVETGDTPESPVVPIEQWVEELGVERRVRLHGHRLRPPADAVTVRVRDAEVLRTDGPFAETKEYIAGFDVLECGSLDEAVEAAARHPMAAGGAMEVRPFWDDEDAEAEIRRLDAELTAAGQDRDVARAMACYAPDVEVFHPVSGLPQSGVDALRKAEELWIATLDGPVEREVLDFHVRVDESIAFSHALVRMRARLADGGTLDSTARVTTGYRAAGDRWQIVHQHTSVPLDVPLPPDAS
ncbi:nuclear transport factor 2 family protein [Streptomyces longispororuber]|uniref:nuclear transport factor 2 family protein n=1 Tax=Streptomyces longispororuber TaxID=68230 RepID=UPI00210A878A|nr:nuclear transport factor 2 family protein [Streptomyces longispororuber]MCQ4207446.1 nuclear transport factor 2 family protein [Streptomyces longispororuber]